MLKESWEKVLNEIELTTTKASFITWFQYVFLTEIASGFAHISVPDAFTKEWVENKYSKTILKILRNSDPEIRDLKIIIAPTPSPNPYFSYIKKPKTTGNKSGGKEGAPQLGFPEFEVNKKTNLNPKYLFDNFIIGSFNELAFAAATSLLKNPGRSYNPLFVYGPSGVGKTHLLQAIGNQALKQNPKIKIFFVPAEKFTNELISSLQNHEMDKFKNKYKQIDFLIVDDVQFLAGKEKTQEEFFHIFNFLYQLNKQIVLSSDRAPKAIPTLEERLRSRFEGGMIADVSKADFETRLAILSKKAVDDGLNIAPEALEFIATNVTHNIRELEGALNRVAASAQLTNQAITIELVEKLLSELISSGKKKDITHKHIIKVVSEFFDINQDELVVKGRKKEVVKPRQIAMYLMRSELRYSYPGIGEKLGGRDHTTAMHAHEKIAREIKTDKKLSEDIACLRERLYAI